MINTENYTLEPSHIPENHKTIYDSYGFCLYKNDGAGPLYISHAGLDTLLDKYFKEHF